MNIIGGQGIWNFLDQPDEITIEPVLPGRWKFHVTAKNCRGIMPNDLLLKRSDQGDHKVLLRVISVYSDECSKHGEAEDVIYKNHLTPTMARLVAMEDPIAKKG